MNAWISLFTLMELCESHVEKGYFKHALGVVEACQPHFTMNRAQYHDTNVRKILRLFGVISLLVFKKSLRNLSKWRRAALNFIVLILSHSIRQLLAIFSGDEF